MKQGSTRAVVGLAAVVVVFAVLACGLPGRLMRTTQQSAWTPSPLTVQAGTGGALLATPELSTPEPQVTLATPDIPLATAVPTVAPPTAPSTPDPHRVVITESDIANVIAGGALENAGVHVENLQVRFTQGKTWITASQVNYSLINVTNLTIVGTLVAQDGALQLQTESVSPQGLVTAMIPGLINQALKQYTSQWYVENVQTLEGRIELRIR